MTTETTQPEFEEIAEIEEKIGRYRIERVIGRGGMGVVVAAFDPELGRRVAIKVLHGGARDVGDRLRREAQALAKIAHPNVVGVYDAGVAGVPYLVMQLVEGDTLDVYLARHRPSRRAVLGLFAQAAAGLGALHAAGLVHRDVKPANLLVDRNGVVRVSDLGLARIDDHQIAPLAEGEVQTSTTIGFMGTPAYMAPEQVDAGPLTAAVDQFSLCVTAWEALFGARPFEAETVAERRAAIMRGALEVPAEVRVSRRTVSALRRGLSAVPGDRFPTIEALARALVPSSTRIWVAGTAGVAALGATVAITAFAASTERTEPQIGIEPDSLRRITHTDVCEEEPTIGPDGTIYYSSQVGEDFELFALDPGAREPRRLTRAPGWNLAPAPSPDGRLLAWVRRDDGPMITMVAPIGSLDKPRSLGVGGFRPAWSRDGRSLWFGGFDHLDLVDATTGEVRRQIAMPANAQPTYGYELADGRLAVLTRSGAANADGIVMFDLTGGARWLLRPATEFPLEQVFEVTPDETAMIIAQVTPTNQIETWSVPLDGGPRTRLFGSAVAARKRLSIHERKVVWSDCLERINLSRLELTPEGQTRFVDLARNSWADYEPAAVPGTADLVFISERSGVPALYRVASTGGEPRVVDVGGLKPDKVTISHDGTQWLFFALAEGDNHDVEGLFVGPSDGRARPRRLVATDDGNVRSSFSRSGDRVYVDLRGDGEHREIAEVMLATGSRRMLVAGPAYAPASSPTDDVLAYLTYPGEGPVQGVGPVVPMLLDLASGSRRRLAPDLAPYPWTHLRWSPDGVHLLVSRSEGATVEIDVTSGAITRRFDVGTDMLVGLTYLGTDVLVSRTTTTGDLWTAQLKAN